MMLATCRDVGRVRLRVRRTMASVVFSSMLLEFKGLSVTRDLKWYTRFASAISAERRYTLCVSMKWTPVTGAKGKVSVLVPFSRGVVSSAWCMLCIRVYL